MCLTLSACKILAPALPRFDHETGSSSTPHLSWGSCTRSLTSVFLCFPTCRVGTVTAGGMLLPWDAWANTGHHGAWPREADRALRAVLTVAVRSSQQTHRLGCVCTLRCGSGGFFLVLADGASVWPTWLRLKGRHFRMQVYFPCTEAPGDSEARPATRSWGTWSKSTWLAPGLVCVCGDHHSRRRENRDGTGGNRLSKVSNALDESWRPCRVRSLEGEGSMSLEMESIMPGRTEQMGMPCPEAAGESTLDERRKPSRTSRRIFTPRGCKYWKRTVL